MQNASLHNDVMTPAEAAEYLRITTASAKSGGPVRMFLSSVSAAKRSGVTAQTSTRGSPAMRSTLRSAQRRTQRRKESPHER